MRTPRVLTAFLFVQATAVTAVAQNADDHLTCYKIKDPLSVAATATLDTALLGVSAACTISKAAMLCAPSSVTSLTTSLATLPLSGPRSTGDVPVRDG